MPAPGRTRRLPAEKEDLVHRLRPGVVEAETFHFEQPPTHEDLERARQTHVPDAAATIRQKVEAMIDEEA